MSTPHNPHKENPGTPAPVLAENFIKKIVAGDLESGKHSQVVTRFPPEPNGFLHIGHAKSICLNFGLAREFAALAKNGAKCHLRMDDTNPEKEDQEYVDSIMADVRWLGFDWGENFFHASDYFDKLFEFAVHLIKEGKAFVCDLNAEQMRQYRGSLTEPGKPSPSRSRSVEVNLALFEDMRLGKFGEGEKVLRAKIDMNSPNINLRDPVIYRIKKADHQRTGDKWCIYPMYDYAHCVSDSLEGITHSVCTLEFEDHRPLYDWYLDQLPVKCHPQQIEFARLNLEYTMMSKRKLLALVEENHVAGWDDPRMPTISGLRRRGIRPEAIRTFCELIGVTKKESVLEIGLLEHAIRDDLGQVCPRIMAVMEPLKVVITNWPEDKVHEIESDLHPQDASFGKRKIPFTRELYIDADDFMENPPKDYFRLRPGGSVRLRYGYVITFQEVLKNSDGSIKEIHCTYDERTFGGATPPDMKKVKGIIHWVSASKNFCAEVRLYDRLFKVVTPESFDDLNPDSLKILSKVYIEDFARNVKGGERYQFERVGYFYIDPKSSKPNAPVFNRTISLKDSWAKIKTV